MFEFRVGIFVLIVHLFGYLSLMQGLFPYSSSSTINHGESQSCFQHQNKSDRRLILMIIDALRSDYVLNKSNSFHLKSVDRLERQGKAFTIQLRTHTPTVTLPRLKALLTGTIPSFWDVIFNYNSSRLEMDNLLYQYKAKYPLNGIVFYGDDTWLKLFPQEIFSRSQGVQSFFVTDFDEIDNIVNKGLDDELNRMNEWNWLILHYLGIDHIGHSHGALNSFIERKLSEMDLIIEKIFDKMSSNDILLLTSDHGMIDQGGHGGASEDEINVPAVFISRNFHLDNEEKTRNDYFQIDLTSTLSSLLEIGIPSNNLGILIEKVVKSVYSSSQSNLIRCLIDDNRRQLLRILSEKKSSDFSQLNDFQSIREEIFSSSNEQNLKLILVNLILFFTSTIILYLSIERCSPLFIFTSIFLGFIIYLLFQEIFFSISIFFTLICLTMICENRLERIEFNEMFRGNLSDQWLKLVVLIHLISLFSSSFIEEEHQCWYFYLSTYFLLRLFEKKCSSTCLVLLSLRLIRNWNGTGNKWLNSPDIGDFLNKDENVFYLFLLDLFSIFSFGLIRWKFFEDRFSSLILLNIFLFRWSLINHWLFIDFVPLLIYFYLFIRLFWNRMKMEEILFYLLFFLHRSHQTFVLLIYYFIYEFIPIENGFLPFLFSQSSFFHLGNSNSFVTIDVSRGFLGLKSYLPIIHGLLIYLSMYGLTLNYFFQLKKKIDEDFALKSLSFFNCFFVLSIVVQRYHLFIWTVFTPKLFYFFAQTFLFLCFLLLKSTNLFRH